MFEIIGCCSNRRRGLNGSTSGIVAGTRTALRTQCAFCILREVLARRVLPILAGRWDPPPAPSPPSSPRRLLLSSPPPPPPPFTPPSPVTPPSPPSPIWLAIRPIMVRHNPTIFRCALCMIITPVIQWKIFAPALCSGSSSTVRIANATRCFFASPNVSPTARMPLSLPSVAINFPTF